MRMIQLSPACLVVASLLLGAEARATPTLQLNNYDSSCGIEATQQGGVVQVTWPAGGGQRGQMTFALDGEGPLIPEIAIGKPTNLKSIAAGLDPVLLLRVGDRDLAKRNGWTIFFDRMQEKPSELFLANIQPKSARMTSQGKRATLSIGDVTAGPFRGELRWTFYAGNPFVLQEAVVSTERKRTAFLYDMGLVGRVAGPTRMTWRDAAGDHQSRAADGWAQASSLAVKGRSIAATFGNGAIAVFPPPHRYFYPLDFSDNLKNVWAGPNYHKQSLPFGFGIRHDPSGDNRYVPWFNAPVGSRQELGMFLLLSPQSSAHALAEASRLTRHDRFAKLPGHVVFSSHYHVEHTRVLMEAQTAADGDAEGQLASGEKYLIPKRLKDPGFVRTFRDLGVDVVHLAEFHFGQTPRLNQQQRLQQLQLLHAECARLSDESLLLLPGEEPNVHLGGHWISFFPHPVYWVLNRPQGTPFVQDHPKLGRVYHVGSEADVLRLLRAEDGLAWTAHPRIKGSTGFPDRYRSQPFFQAEQFLGAAWKAMPADLSEPRLGSRVLNLLDDMSNWGIPKYVPGEVDVFKIEPDHELYGHMNVNYLRLNKTPKFEKGWRPILQSLRNGQFFVTTGEVLISDFRVNGKRSGESVKIAQDLTVEMQLQWTFPLAFAEIISGNGQHIQRQRIDLSDTGSYGEKTIRVPVSAHGSRWVRVEVWDIATNGAFTQPVWLR